MEDTTLGTKEAMNTGDEQSRYREEKAIARELEPLLWWKMKEKEFPILAGATMEILAPMTSSCSERAFSGGLDTP